MGQIFRVSAANDGTPITDVRWSADWCYYQSQTAGMYWVDVGWNQDFWCSAPNYTTCYGNTSTQGTVGSSGVYVVGLSYTGGWPQTY